MGPQTFDIPIIRAHTQQHLTAAIELVASTSWDEYFVYLDDEGNIGYSTRTIWGGVPLEGIQNSDDHTRTATINEAISHIEALTNMTISPLPIVPFELFEPAVLNMLRGMITPEDAARSIHLNVAMWLGE